ncbi:hypothetical protein [Vibrio hepatarius]|uniref:hypothetical protein n=1 Tax=Vibrio hepatarius TaxID=171383 RepID=UPI001C09F343|nr:hypothetical protein [Vibrio hepatarius]MBU2899035.1 hypothetical protein [Vibrio hepatarius]
MVTIELEDLNALLPILGEICVASDVELCFQGHFLSIKDVQPLVSNVQQSGQSRTVETHYQVTLGCGEALIFPIIENRPVITKSVIETLISIPEFTLSQTANLA